MSCCEDCDECICDECPEDLCVEQNGKCALGDDCACKRGDGTDNF